MLEFTLGFLCGGLLIALIFWLTSILAKPLLVSHESKEFAVTFDATDARSVHMIKNSGQVYIDYGDERPITLHADSEQELNELYDRIVAVVFTK